MIDKKVLDIFSGQDLIQLYERLSDHPEQIEELVINVKPTFNYINEFTNEEWGALSHILGNALSECTALTTLSINEEDGSVNNLRFAEAFFKTTQSLRSLSYTSSAKQNNNLAIFLRCANNLSEQLHSLTFKVCPNKNFTFGYLNLLLKNSSRLKHLFIENLSIKTEDLDSLDCLLNQNPDLQSINLSDAYLVKSNLEHNPAPSFSSLAKHPSLVQFIVAHKENQRCDVNIGLALLKAIEQNRQLTSVDTSALHNGTELLTPSGYTQQQLIDRNIALLEKTKNDLVERKARLTPYQNQLLRNHCKENLNNHSSLLNLLKYPHRLIVPSFKSMQEGKELPFDINNLICSFLTPTEQSMLLYAGLQSPSVLTFSNTINKEKLAEDKKESFKDAVATPDAVSNRNQNLFKKLFNKLKFSR